MFSYDTHMMYSFWGLYKKELSAYFYSLILYIFLTVFLVTLSFFFWKETFLVGQSSMRIFFEYIPWFFLFLLPALTMRIWSEEKKAGTLEILRSLPVSSTSIVLAKYCSLCTLLFMVLVLSFPFAVILFFLGGVDIGAVCGGFLGAFLLGGSFLSIGQFFSFLTKNQIVAFILTIISLFLLFVIGFPLFFNTRGVVSNFLYAVSAHTHYLDFTKGIISMSGMYYYVSLVVLFLYLNVRFLSWQEK